RAGQRLWNLGGEPAAKAVGLDEGEVADGAGATREPLPVLGDTGTIRADGAEAGDDDLCHAERSFPAMKRERLSKEAKCSVRSWFSSIAMPKRSSMAMDSSMKSSESRPMDPATPFGSGVDSVVSAARRGSNFKRATRIVFSSSRTSFSSMSLLCRESDLRAPAAPAPGHTHTWRPGRARERQAHERPAPQPLARPARDERLERRGVAGTVLELAAAPEHGARGGLHQRTRRRPASARPQRRALLERLHGQHQRRVGAAGREQRPRLPER